jgi:hypothetical protein
LIQFQHIPKTGGSTFYTVLKRIYGTSQIIDLNNEDVDYEFSNELFKSKISSEITMKENAKSVFGHFRYGIHNNLKLKARYVTFFRNPIDQFLSQYYYILNLDEYPDVKHIVSLTENLEQYINSDLCKYASNMQTYFLCDAHGRNSFLNNAEAMLSQAQENLKQDVIFCGIFEHFDESLIILKEILGWKKLPLYTKHKVNKNRPKLEEHDDSIIQQINELNKYDKELYSLAYEKFKEVKSGIKYLTFKVLIFRIVNKIYQLLRRHH